METAFSEIRVEDDDVLLSRFEILPGRSFKIAPIGEFTQIYRTGRGFLSGEFSKHITKFINACKPDDRWSLLMTDTFLLNCLTEDDGDYERSSFLAECVFEKLLPGVPAIIFPSTRWLGCLNFVIRSDNFWENWKIHSVLRGQGKHLACGYYSFTNIRHVTHIV